MPAGHGGGPRSEMHASGPRPAEALRKLGQRLALERDVDDRSPRILESRIRDQTSIHTEKAAEVVIG